MRRGQQKRRLVGAVEVERGSYTQATRRKKLHSGYAQKHESQSRMLVSATRGLVGESPFFGPSTTTGVPIFTLS